MRYTDLIGTQADYIEHRSIKPLYYPCPQCETTGKRKRVLTRRVAHVAALHRRSWIDRHPRSYGCAPTGSRRSPPRVGFFMLETSPLSGIMSSP